MTRFSVGLVGLIVNGKKQMWSAVSIRKSFYCEACKEKIHIGQIAYRPLSNDGNRGHRLHSADECLNRYERIKS